MALSPIHAVTFALLWAFWVSLVTQATYNPAEIPKCTGWDVVTGCDSTKDSILSRMLLGTIPGAPGGVNVFFATLGVICRLVGIWAIMELIRGT